MTTTNTSLGLRIRLTGQLGAVLRPTDWFLLNQNKPAEIMWDHQTDLPEQPGLSMPSISVLSEHRRRGKN